MSQHCFIAATRKWIDELVVEQNLCPFAQPSIAHGGLRITLCLATDPAALSEALVNELLFLQSAAGESFDTSLLIHPHVLRDFAHFNDYLDCCDDILIELSLVGEFQIASFHPHYRFAGSHEHAVGNDVDNDTGNYTNRSPYPMLHLLRESSVTRAVQSHPDPRSIPTTNIKRLETLGVEKLEGILAGCKKTDES